MRRKFYWTMGIIMLIGLATLITGLAEATPITFSGSSTNPYTSQAISASATFDYNGTNLFVTLMNTGAAAMAPSDVLTALFFNINGNPSLTTVSANLAAGSTVLYPPSGVTGGSGPNVGGEWAYQSGLSGTPGGGSYGISSSGFNLFGNGNFNGPNLQDTVAVDGFQYGIVSGVSPNGNPAVTGPDALISNSVVFLLSGLQPNFSLDQITNVQFQYGTALSEPSIPGNPVPEPATMFLLGSGLVGLAGFGRKKFKKQTTA